MSMNRSCALSVLAGLVALAVAACDTTQQKTVEVEEYEFINDISGLVRTDDEEGIVIYDRPNLDLAQYSKFIVDPVKVAYTKPEMRNLDEEKLKEIQEYFVEAFTTQLQEGDYEVVTDASEGTLRIEITIVDLRVPSAAYNAIQLVGSPVAATVGSITIEAALRDASTNQLESVAVARRSGDHVSATPWSNWQDVKDSVDAWAEELREALDAARGVTS